MHPFRNADQMASGSISASSSTASSSDSSSSAAASSAFTVFVEDVLMFGRDGDLTDFFAAFTAELPSDLIHQIDQFVFSGHANWNRVPMRRFVNDSIDRM